MKPWATVLICVMAGLNVVALVFNAFFKGYGATKGKNLATKEDLRIFVDQARQEAGAKKEAEISAIQTKLDTVVEQNRAIVQSSEEIKRQVSGRQRMWELRKEVIFDVVKTTGRLMHLITVYSSKLLVYEKKKATAQASELAKELTQLSESVKDEIGQMWQHEGIIGLLFEPRVSEAVRTVGVGAATLLSSLRELPLKESIEETSQFAGKCTEVAVVLKGELLRENF